MPAQISSFVGHLKLREYLPNLVVSCSIWSLGAAAAEVFLASMSRPSSGCWVGTWSAIFGLIGKEGGHVGVVVGPADGRAVGFTVGLVEGVLVGEAVFFPNREKEPHSMLQWNERMNRVMLQLMSA